MEAGVHAVDGEFASFRAASFRRRAARAAPELEPTLSAVASTPCHLATVNVSLDDSPAASSKSSVGESFAT